MSLRPSRCDCDYHVDIGDIERILTSNRASREPDGPPPERIAGDGKDLFIRDAQASCRCNCVASKSTPFFQIARVVLAIFRARVRRAIVGRIPDCRSRRSCTARPSGSQRSAPFTLPVAAPSARETIGLDSEFKVVQNQRTI
jgi:hypothetical protein